MLIESVSLLIAVCVLKVIFLKQRRVSGMNCHTGMLYWIKWIVVYIWIKLRRGGKGRRNYYRGKDLGYLDEIEPRQEGKLESVIGEKSPFDLERVQKARGQSAVNIEDIHFSGFEKKNSSIKDDVSVVLEFSLLPPTFAEILLFVNIPGIGFLQHPCYPERIVCGACSDEYTYLGQGISVEMLEPMRRWRISYNGLMRKMNESNRLMAKCGEELVHVKLSLIWSSYTPIVDFHSEIHPSCIARVFASKPWRWIWNKKAEMIHNDQTHYEQWGQLNGIIQIENQDPRTLLLRGPRRRAIVGKQRENIHRQITILIHLEDGSSINATVTSMDETTTSLHFGYFILPNRRKDDITYIDINFLKIYEDGSIPKEIQFSLRAGGKTHSVVGMLQMVSEFEYGINNDGRRYECLCDFYVNGIPGRGLTKIFNRQSPRRPKVLMQPEFSEVYSCDAQFDKAHDDSLILRFEEKRCQINSLVGGKGSQLAKLTEWSKRTRKFRVPSGFCVTTKAFERHLQNNEAAKTAINELSRACGNDTKEMCKRIILAFQNSSMHNGIFSSIKQEYDRLTSHGKFMVSVRSSAIDEDSKNLSAAGQLKTYLGIRGIDGVFEAVKKSWGHQYCYKAVQYRKQHGQPIFSSMGVVIQLMVEQPQTAGVLFTQHPITGHPAHMMINANYGLGETVVSGRSEPDTIVISCLPNEEKTILSKVVGSKKMKMICGESGIREIVTSDEEARVLSLKEEQIFELTDIGEIIQSLFGSSRDIEWTISSDDKINLLQARPITTDFTETDFEILHEFDSAFPNNDFLLTTANVSEMMPGALTPLSSSVFFRAVSSGTESFYLMANVRRSLPYCDIYVAHFLAHGFLNYKELLALNKYVNLGSQKEAIDASIFGKVCDMYSNEEALLYHDNYASLLRRIWNTAMFWKKLLGSKQNFKKVIRKAKNLRTDGNSSMELYRYISSNIEEFYVECWRNSIIYAALSCVANRIIMEILTRGKPDWTTSHFSDVSMIYGTSSQAATADAPSYLNKIAKIIYFGDEKEEFLSLSPQNAIEWLLADNGEAGDVFRQFLEKCGHRCIEESEFREKSWAEDPGKLGSSLKAMVENYVDQSPKTLLTADEAIANLKTPVSFLGRLLLKWVIPVARRSVGGREWGKSECIKVSDIFKRSYWNLAGLMKREGFLPDADLLFFLTHAEIGRLLKNRSPRLLIRAKRRRRLHLMLDMQVFPELSTSIPVIPIEQTEANKCNGNSLQVTGCPVSHGIAQGTARVVLNTFDAEEIKQGDILIVRTTDVGWSPYFPLVSGLVTDIGGLISHGAVVAREYGLPCIVGCKKATRLFKSGDHVLLDGEKGTLQRLVH